MKTRIFLFLMTGGLLFFLPNAAYAAGDLSDWVYNLSTQVPALINLIIAISYVSGFGFLIGAFSKLKRCAQATTMMSAQESIAGPLIHLLIGTVLIYFAGFINVGSETFFGSDAAIAYQADTQGVGIFGGIIKPIILIVRLIGYIAFVKGCYLLAKLGGHHGQPGNMSKGIVHIVGGILAINMEATYLVLLNTLQGPSI